MVEKESTFGGQPSRRWQKVSRVLRSESIYGRRGKGWALNRLSGGVGLKYNNGPKHNMGARRFTYHKSMVWANKKVKRGGSYNKVDWGGPFMGIKGVERGAGQWAQPSKWRTETRGSSQAQEVGPIKNQADKALEDIVEDLVLMSIKSLERMERPNTLQQGIDGLEEEDRCNEADFSGLGLEDQSSRRTGIFVQEGVGYEESNADIGQKHVWLSELHSEDDNREGVDLDIEPLECYPIDPIVSIEPLECYQVDPHLRR